MRIYLSFPITGHDLAERRENSESWAAHIKDQGHETANPLDVEVCADRSCIEADGAINQGDGNHSWQCYMKSCMKMLMDCDAIYMLNGWEHSRGALLELFVAVSCGLQAFHQGDILP